eukprot:CAMPEP_0184017890 /NCGR_PEP_ID=MMETSP0954-20121128/7813_1 /TAXON_ID=627963 /ORGANISM="Aplanochytrium sp, Strain PBS07" /LENGTH=308 /DNA_ID=CAMNT_0026299227 /DNA_START=422 /DNA_END=1348 /DNA_ORIENTATION=+
MATLKNKSTKLCLVTDYDCMLYPPLEDENLVGFTDILDKAFNSSFSFEFDQKSDCLKVPLQLLYQVHDKDYVNSILQKCCGLASHHASLTSSLKSAGAVCCAIDETVQHGSNSLCIVRPASHGSGREARHFCSRLCRGYFNCTAIAAEYAASKQEKVCVLDLGPHVGIGTLEIIDWLVKDKGRDMFFGSVYIGDEAIKLPVSNSDRQKIIHVNSNNRESWENSARSLVNESIKFFPSLILVSFGYETGTSFLDAESYMMVFENLLLLGTKVVFLLESGANSTMMCTLSVSLLKKMIELKQPKATKQLN